PPLSYENMITFNNALPNGNDTAQMNSFRSKTFRPGEHPTEALSPSKSIPKLDLKNRKIQSEGDTTNNGVDGDIAMNLYSDRLPGLSSYRRFENQNEMSMAHYSESMVKFENCSNYISDNFSLFIDKDNINKIFPTNVDGRD